MESYLCRQGALGRTLLWLGLCVMTVTAMPVPEGSLEPLEFPEDLSTDQALLLLHVLRTVLANNSASYPKYTVSTKRSARRGLESSMTGDDSNGRDIETRKRGFGIAGLDNVDIITSILDGPRPRPRPGNIMSTNLTLNQLKELMAKAG